MDNIALQTRPEALPAAALGRINLNLTKSNTRVKAFADLIYAGIQLKGLRVIDGDKGLFVAPPSELNKVTSKWNNHFYFADDDLRAHITTAVLAEYDRKQQQNGPQAAAPVMEQPVTDMPDDIPF